MKIIYTGNLAEGSLKNHLNGESYAFKRGEAIDVSEEFAKIALQNPEWNTADKKKASEK